MADEEDIEQGGETPSLPSGLTEVVNSLPAGPGQDYMQEAADKFNDYWAKQQAAERVTRTGQQLVDTAGNFTNQMIAGIHDNPTFTDTAIDMSRSVAKALVHDHPFLDDDQRPAMADQLGAEFGQQLARAGVMRWALTDADHAHALLDKYQGLLPADQVQQLSDHIDVLHDARQTDAAQQATVSDKQKADLSTDVLVNLASGIVMHGLPAGFNVKAVADQRLSPDDTYIAQQFAQKAADIAAGKTSPGATDASLLMKQATNRLGVDRPISAIMGDLVRANVPLEDVAQYGKLLQNPDDAKQFVWALNAAKIRNAGVDGDLSPANTDKLNDMAHFLLKQYAQVGAQAFQDLPLNPLAKGGLEAQEQALQVHQAKAQAKLEDIFARREARSVYQTQRQQFELDRFNAKITYEKEKAAETKMAQEAAQQRADRQRAADRAERAQQAAANRQARAQETAARLDEQRAAREQRALIEAQRPARETSPASEFARGNRLFREFHRGP